MLLTRSIRQLNPLDLLHNATNTYFPTMKNNNINPNPQLEIIGHRGYSAVTPENTLASLKSAIAAGVKSVEFDIHASSCGTPVLFHDDTLNRTTNGLGPLKCNTFRQLQDLDAGKWFSEEFSGEKIPSLIEAINQLNGQIDCIYVEVKGVWEFQNLDIMIQIIRETNFVDKTTFLSMDWDIMDQIRCRDPGLGIGFIVETSDRFDKALKRVEGKSNAILDLSHTLSLENPYMIDQAHKIGIDVVVWTVNNIDEARRLKDIGVTRFTTDQIELLLGWAAS